MRISKFGDMIFISLLAATLLIPVKATAQNAVPGGGNSDKPIEITAGKSLEWHRNELKYIARGQVKATQGDTAIFSEILTADYRDGQTSSNEIYQLTAEENVRVQNPTTTIYGDRAVYDVDKAYAVMTGQNLKMESPDQVVTARDRMEYWSNKGEALAIGNAKVVRGEDTINADVIKAIFKKNASGSNEIDTLHANRNVVIVTPTETLTGDNGVYYAASNTAEIIGNVKIVRGPNVLEGVRGEVDLNTNISKIFGDPAAAGTTGPSPGRVRGVFYPGSDKAPAPGQPPAAPPSPQAAPAPAAPQPQAPIPVVPAQPAPLKSPPLFAPVTPPPANQR